jgi:hypothetical protein
VTTDHHPPRLSHPQSPRARCGAGRRLASLAVAAAALTQGTPSHALDFGPFFLTGFAKVDVTRGTNQCTNCQLYPEENKQRFWADEIIPGTTYGTQNETTTLFQPYLGARIDLGGGFKFNALLSQRWRDGSADIPGYLYEANVGVSHEDYGSLRVGDMTSRGWSIADFPYGSDLGLSEEWANSGAGYGLLIDREFKINKPFFLEFWAQYRRGDLVLDAIVQETRNGNPQAFGQGPFTSLSPDAKNDAKLGSSSQGIVLLMGRYEIDSRFEVSGGVRRNYWSGAYAVLTDPGPPPLWNSMFNVDWGGTRNGVPNPGYSAWSLDYLAGLRYRWEKWIFATGMVYLGQANTANPSERGQSNSALINTLGAVYDVGYGFNVYGLVGMVNYREKGLSPMSMPTNSAFTNVDSRVAKHGNWVTLGVLFVF